MQEIQQSTEQIFNILDDSCSFKDHKFIILLLFMCISKLWVANNENKSSGVVVITSASQT